MLSPMKRYTPHRSSGIDDRLLLSRVVNDKDMEALAALYAAYYVRLERFISRQCNGAADAQDLAQDVFVRLLETHARYEIEAPPVAYLLTVAKRVIAQHMRCQARRRDHISIESIEEDALDSEVRRSDPRLEEIPWQESGDVVEEATAPLTPKAREAIRLRYVQGLSTAEAARVAGCSINAFYSRIERALKALQQTHSKSEH